MEEKNLDENKEEVEEEVPKAEPASPAGSSTIEQARKENDRREKLLEREETHCYFSLSQMQAQPIASIYLR
ncbi:hypothetical protein LCGC14_1244120 [marine sediment metagenome]|uniref:Uncharacterized protein n=1 Tax=marine sediment metagenome TaxID=412755 RepID=A0A0F9NM88_9ZZZZ